MQVKEGRIDLLAEMIARISGTFGVGQTRNNEQDQQFQALVEQ
jgi:hypothetical protein